MVPRLSVRLSLAVLMLLIGVSSASPKQVDMPSRDLLRLLNQPLEMKDFQQPMTFKEFLNLLSEAMSLTGKEFPILVNTPAFRDEFPNAQDVFDASIKFQPYPKKMTFGAALKLGIDQIPSKNAVYIVRQGRIEITTLESTKTPRLLEQRIAVRFDRTPLESALYELSEISGLSIVLDPRAEKKAQTTVTATFRNDISLEGVLRALCELADLRFVNLHDGVFVTTPENAERQLKELKAKAPRESAIP